MKLLSRIFNSLPKRLAAAALLALAVALPVSALADATVAFSAQTTVSNATINQGTMNWGSSASASYNDVVAVQVVYDNNEAPDSGKTTNNLHVKINIPSNPGISQTITTVTSGDNIKTVNGSVNVNLDRSDAYLQYIPGTATWKHASTANGPMTVTQSVSDDVVLSPNGINLGTENPCQAGSIVIQAREVIPGVKVIKQVEGVNQTNAWTTQNTANPGDTLKYMITYQNTGNTVQNNVVIRDNLPPKMSLVSGSTVVYTTATPNGSKQPDDNITGGGIDIGSYLPNAGAYVVFEVKVPDAGQLACGLTEFRNVGVARPEGMNEYYNTAITDVNKTCQTPTYACTAFHVTTGSNRTVTVDQFGFKASDNSTLSNVTLNWGDTQQLVTNNVKGQSHQYSKDGTYTISLSNFKVNGKTVDVSGNCSQQVTFTTPGVPPTTPPTTLVNTGPGQVAALFAAVAVLGAFAHRLFLSRRLSRD